MMTWRNSTLFVVFRERRPFSCSPITRSSWKSLWRIWTTSWTLAKSQVSSKWTNTRNWSLGVDLRRKRLESQRATEMESITSASSRCATTYIWCWACLRSVLLSDRVAECSPPWWTAAPLTGSPNGPRMLSTASPNQPSFRLNSNQLTLKYVSILPHCVWPQALCFSLIYQWNTDLHILVVLLFSLLEKQMVICSFSNESIIAAIMKWSNKLQWLYESSPAILSIE